MTIARTRIHVGPVISKWDYRESALQGNYSIGRSKDGCGSVSLLLPLLFVCLPKEICPAIHNHFFPAFAAVLFVSSRFKNNLLKVRNACG
jgi:hypothetical protein